MSVFARIVLGAIVAGGVGLGIWSSKQDDKTPAQEHARQEARIQADAAATLTKGSTNDDLDKDMASIDGQLKLVSESSADVDQSFDDKQIEQ